MAYLDFHGTVIALQYSSQLVQLIFPDLDLVKLGRL